MEVHVSGSILALDARFPYRTLYFRPVLCCILTLFLDCRRPTARPGSLAERRSATLIRRNRSAVLAVRFPGERTPRRLRRCAAPGAGAVAPARPGEGGHDPGDGRHDPPQCDPRRRQRYLPGPLCQKGQPTVFHFPRCATLSGNPSLSLVDGRRRCRRTRPRLVAAVRSMPTPRPPPQSRPRPGSLAERRGALRSFAGTGRRSLLARMSKPLTGTLSTTRSGGRCGGRNVAAAARSAVFQRLENERQKLPTSGKPMP